MSRIQYTYEIVAYIHTMVCAKSTFIEFTIKIKRLSVRAHPQYIRTISNWMTWRNN